MEDLKKGFSNEQIDFIFNKFKEAKIKITDKISEEGYFLFEFGNNTVHRFRIKGLKNWMFGLWVRRLEGGNVSLELFYDHLWHINKFKPSACSYSKRTVIKEEALDGKVFYPSFDKFLGDSIKDIRYLKNNELKVYSEHYCPEGYSIYKNYMRDLWYQKVTRKYERFKNNKLSYVKGILVYIKVKFKFIKYFRRLSFRILDRCDKKTGFRVSPRYELHIISKKVDKPVNDEIDYYYTDLYNYVMSLNKIKNLRVETHCWFEDSKSYGAYMISRREED